MGQPTDVKFAEVVAGLKKPGELLLAQWDATKASALHMLLGIYDEHIELMQALSDNNQENIVEEAGDFCFYCEGLLQDLRINPDALVFEEAEILQGLAPQDLLGQMEIVLTPIKRYLVYNKPINLNDAGVGLIRLQALAIAWAITNGKSTPDEVLRKNVEKLTKVRYKDGYSDKAANERSDKK